VGRVDEVQGEEGAEDVQHQVGQLEQDEPAEHRDPPQCGKGRAGSLVERRRSVSGRRRQRTRSERQHERHDRQHSERLAPTAADRDRRRNEKWSRHHSDRPRQRPARHVAFAAVGVDVHQRRLRQAHERARGGRECAERKEQQHEPLGRGRERKPTCERDAAPEYNCSAEAGIAEDAEDGLENRAGEERNAEQNPDLGVREREFLANQRPRGIAGAPGELVQQLDR
jgi:hypothetical protein